MRLKKVNKKKLALLASASDKGGGDFCTIHQELVLNRNVRLQLGGELQGLREDTHKKIVFF